MQIYIHLRIYIRSQIYTRLRIWRNNAILLPLTERTRMKEIVNVSKTWGIGKDGDLLVTLPPDM